MRILFARLYVCSGTSFLISIGFVLLAVGAILSTSFTTNVTTAFADQVPPDVADWIRDAKKSVCLKVHFYEPDQRPNAFPGWTDFDLSLEYKYSHRTKWKNMGDDKIAVTIFPTFTTIKPVISHVVKLPVSIDALIWHESVLGHHELDHVAIGSHPRLIMLATHLVKNIGSMNRRVDRVSDVTRKWAEESIAEEVTNRRRAVQVLVTCNNERLDSLTRHGGKDLIRREEFFDRLFLKENLDESKFAYLGEVIGLIESETYRNADIQFSR